MNNFPGFPDAVAAQVAALPFFSRQMTALGISPQELGDSRVLSHFPCMDRSVLRDRATDLIADFDCQPIYSSGTTGAPILVFRGMRDEVRFWNHLQRALDLPTRSLHVLFLCTLREGPEGEWEREIGTLKVFIKRISVLRNGSAALDAYEEPFDMLSCSTSGMQWLLSQNMRLPTQGIYSTALPFEEHVRPHLRGPWMHTYSTTETGPIARLCTHSETYHSLDDIYLEEIAGRLAVTKLFASALPLVRYLTGDFGQLTGGTCACGFSGTSLTNLQGRKGDKWQNAF